MPKHKKDSIIKLENLHEHVPETRNIIKEEPTALVKAFEKEEKKERADEQEITGRKTEIKDSDEKSDSKMRKLHKKRRVRRSKRDRISVSVHSLIVKRSFIIKLDYFNFPNHLISVYSIRILFCQFFATKIIITREMI